MKINSLKELLSHEKDILERINNIPNCKLLYSIHPFMLLVEAGIELSEQAKKEMIKYEPGLSALSVIPYNIVKRKTKSQDGNEVKYHKLKALFRRKS